MSKLLIVKITYCAHSIDVLLQHRHICSQARHELGTECHVSLQLFNRLLVLRMEEFQVVAETFNLYMRARNTGFQINDIFLEIGDFGRQSLHLYENVRN